MTRVDLIICGRNIFFSLNRSSIIFMSFINGFLIILIGRVVCWRVFSVFCSINSVMFLISEYFRRLFIFYERYFVCWALAVSSVLLSRYFSVSFSKRSVLSSRRLRIIFFIASRSLAGRSS